MNGVQITTPQLGFSADNVSLSSLARAIPSCRFMFIFQLPATIFFLIFLFFFKSLYIILDSSLCLTHDVHAHSLSASVSRNSGMTNHDNIHAMLPDTWFWGIMPIAECCMSTLVMLSSGSALWLHLPMMRPSCITTRPGLLLITVRSVVASVRQNGYSAPVMSFHRSISLSLLAVRQ